MEVHVPTPGFTCTTRRGFLVERGGVRGVHRYRPTGLPHRSARGTQPRPPPPVPLKQRTGRAATLRQPLPRQARPGAGCHDKHFLPLAPQPSPPSLWPPAGAPPTAGTGRRAGECGTVAEGVCSRVPPRVGRAEAAVLPSMFRWGGRPAEGARGFRLP